MWFPTLLPHSLSPTCFPHPTLSSFFPTLQPLNLSLVTLPEWFHSAQTHCATRAEPFPTLGFSLPICTRGRGRAPGSPVVQHCHHHPSMEQVLIEKKGGEGGAPICGAPTGCQALPHLGQREATCMCGSGGSERYRESLKGTEPVVTPELSVTYPPCWLAPAYCALGSWDQC